MSFIDSCGQTIEDNNIVKFTYQHNHMWYEGHGICKVKSNDMYVITDGRSIPLSHFKFVKIITKKIEHLELTMHLTEFVGTISKVYWKHKPMLTHIIEFIAPNEEKFIFGNVDFLKHSASKYLNILMNVVGSDIDAAALISKKINCSVVNNQIVAIADFSNGFLIMDLRNLYDEEV